MPAACGKKADWFRNLLADPHARVTAGRTTHAVTASVVTAEKTVRIHRLSMKRHPLAARLVGRFIGVSLVHADPADLAARIPLVALVAGRPPQTV